MSLAVSIEWVIETAVRTSDQKLATLPWSGTTSSIQRLRDTWKVPSSRRQSSVFQAPRGDFVSSTGVRIDGLSNQPCARASLVTLPLFNIGSVEREGKNGERLF